MDAGNKIIKQFLNCLELSDKDSTFKEPQFRNKSSSSQTAKQNRPLVFLKKQQDLRKRILRIQPTLTFNHVYKVFGMLGVNERAIYIPDFQESLLVTQFYGRTIERIQIYRNAVLIDIAPPDKSGFQFSHDYISQKFKSYGDVKFYHLALQIEEISQIFYKFIGSIQNGPKDKNDSITKYLDSMGDSMFFIKFGMNKVAIAKSLLQYLDYDLEEFVIEAVKYKSIFHQIFSSNCYHAVISHTISIFKYLLSFLQKTITFEEFGLLSTLNFSDYIYSKHNMRTYCDFSLFVPTANALCLKITNIRYKSNQLQWKSLYKCESKDPIDSLKKDIREKEYSIIDQLKELPTEKIAGYTTCNLPSP